MTAKPQPTKHKLPKSIRIRQRFGTKQQCKLKAKDKQKNKSKTILLVATNKGDAGSSMKQRSYQIWNQTKHFTITTQKLSSLASQDLTNLAKDPRNRNQTNEIPL
ncbi:hypothetical protein Bca4012_084568 [Brassica carinata]